MINNDNKENPLKFNYPKKQRAFSDFVDGITLTVVAILIIVIFMVSMTTIAFDTQINFKDFGVQVFILYFCTVSVNLLVRSFGRRKGRNTQKWKDAKSRVEGNNQKILDGGYGGLTFSYCRAWEEEELGNAQLRILSYAGISLEDFRTKYRKYGKKELKEKYPDLTEFQIKIIRKAARVKRLRYNEKYLQSAQKRIGRSSPSGSYTSSEVTVFQTAKVVVSALITSLFSASLVLQIIADPTFATVVACCVKIVMLLIFSAFGLVNGYNLTATRETEEMGAKADEQERFMKWCRIQKAEPSLEVVPSGGNFVDRTA